eukprot:m.4640 g.4640  ORF g.4640 m.4640 type:complete len:66 (-) comp2060_c0_seq1:178-375(-)
MLQRLVVARAVTMTMTMTLQASVAALTVVAHPLLARECRSEFAVDCSLHDLRKTWRVLSLPLRRW